MSFDPYQRRVKDEMSTDVVSISSTAPLLNAIDLMDEKGVTALPVVDQDGRCIGMISKTDVISSARATASMLEELDRVGEAVSSQFVRRLIDNSILRQSVHDAMRFKLKCVDQETPIAKAGSKMLWARFHHLPVVDEDQRLVGIVSTLDLLAAFVKGTAKHGDRPLPENTISDLTSDEASD